LKSTIYYFTSTGNSLEVSRKLAEGIGQSEIISISKEIDKDKIASSSDIIGIITPVYAMGAPRMVTDFLRKLNLTKDQYVFTIATSNGMVSSIHKQLNKVLNEKGISINAGFSVKEQYHKYPNHDSRQVDFNISLTRKKASKMQSFDTRKDEIIDIIRNKKSHKYESSSFIFNMMGSLIHYKAIETFKTDDKSFKVNDKCSNCGICSKVCPRDNIEFINDKPKWKNDCELCYGCYQWCPSGAIDYNEYRGVECRGHNSNVVMKDIIESNN